MIHMNDTERAMLLREALIDCLTDASRDATVCTELGAIAARLSDLNATAGRIAVALDALTHAVSRNP